MNAYKKGVIAKVTSFFLALTFAISPLSVAAQELVEAPVASPTEEAVVPDASVADPVDTQETIESLGTTAEEIAPETAVEALQPDSLSESAIVEEVVDTAANEYRAARPRFV